MKKSASSSTESPKNSLSNAVPSPKRSKPTEQLVSVPLRTHTRLEPPSQFFAVVPDVDTESMLCHASETLASLSVMATDLARELEGPRRHVILAIQQLSALGELLVNRALDNLEPPVACLKARPAPALNIYVPFFPMGFSSWIDTCLSPASTAASRHC